MSLLSFPLYVFKGFIQEWLTFKDLGYCDTAFTCRLKRETFLWLIDGIKVSIRLQSTEQLKLCSLWLLKRNLLCQSLCYSNILENDTLTHEQLQPFTKVFSKLSFLCLEGQTGEFLRFICLNQIQLNTLLVKAFPHWTTLFEHYELSKSLKSLNIKLIIGDFNCSPLFLSSIENLALQCWSLPKVNLSSFPNLSQLTIYYYNDKKLAYLFDLLSKHPDIKNVNCIKCSQFKFEDVIASQQRKHGLNHVIITVNDFVEEKTDSTLYSLCAYDVYEFTS